MLTNAYHISNRSTAFFLISTAVIMALFRACFPEISGLIFYIIVFSLFGSSVPHVSEAPPCSELIRSR